MKKALLALLTTLVLGACSDQSDEPNTPSSNGASTQRAITTAPAAQTPQRAPLIQLIEEQAQASIAAVAALRQHVSAFIRQPTQAMHDQALAAWHASHDTMVFWYWLRALPVHDSTLDENRIEPTLQHSIWSRLDKYPLIPGYLDSVPGYPLSGLVNSERPIDIETLEQEHQFSDEAYVTLGFHALEALLKGANQEESERAKDFATLPNTQLDPLRDASMRRSLYALALAKQIDEDMNTLVTAWATPSGSYRQQLLLFTQEQWQAALTKLLDTENSDLNFHHKDGTAGLNQLSTLRERLQTLLLKAPATPDTTPTSDIASPESPE